MIKYLTVFGMVALVTVFAAAGLSTVAPSEAQAAGKTVKSCTGTNITLKADEYRSYQLHNQKRVDRGLSRLCIHPQLQKAARAHSKDMIERDYFSHNTKGRNESYDQRLKRYGYTIKNYSYRATAENIAWGTGPSGEPGSIFNAWMRSDTHRPNILGKSFREVGIGTYTGTFQGKQDATMYTADFGVRRR